MVAAQDHPEEDPMVVVTAVAEDLLAAVAVEEDN